MALGQNTDSAGMFICICKSKTESPKAVGTCLRGW